MKQCVASVLLGLGICSSVFAVAQQGKRKNAVVKQAVVPTPPVVPAVVETEPSPILMYVEQMPEFNGNVVKYLSDNIKYPDAALKAGIEGRVVVKFVVNELGAVKNPIIMRGLSPECDSEAVRVVSAMPNWKPGRHAGKPVSVYYNLPISFRLPE